MYATAKEVVILIEALKEGRKNYTEILAKFDKGAVPIVIGEEDNK
jgi:hypothetical protein